MSGLTKEWMLRTEENKLQYWIDIADFDKKVKTYKKGRNIYSKIFKIGNSSFQIKIEPNSSQTRNFVAVYLHNKSSWRVKAGATFKVETEEEDYHQSITSCYFMAKDYLENEGDSMSDSWGRSDFIPHNRCKKNNLLDDVGEIRLQINIELFEEEVVYSRSLEKDMEDKIDGLSQKSIENKLEMDEFRRETQTEMKTLKKELKRIQNLLSNNLRSGMLTPSAAAARSSIECPVCYDEVEPPMRLKQCGQGHIICDDCHNKRIAEAAGNPGEQQDGTNCISCREPITGRPSVLEQMLGLI